MSLPMRVLGRTALEVSILGHGAEALGRDRRSFEALIEFPKRGLAEFIGKAISRRKSEFTIVTKCGWTRDWSPAWSPPELANAIDQSLRDLKIDGLDVLLLHSCSLDDLKRGESIRVIQKAQRDGKARFIGYSGDNDALKWAVESEVFDVVECSFSILDQGNALHIAEAQRRNLGVMIKRTLANAVPGRSEKPRSEYAAQYWPRWQEFRAALQPQFIQPEIDWLDTALRYAAFWPGVTSVLVGSSHADHMLAHLQNLAKGPLPDPTRAALLEAYSKVGLNWPGLG